MKNVQFQNHNQSIISKSRGRKLVTRHEIQKGDRIFYQLDIHIEEGKPAQAKKQTKERVLADCPSS